MKKIPRLFIALMILSLGFITGCTQQNGTSNNYEENTLEYNEFINWTTNTFSEMATQFQPIQNSWGSNWDDCRIYIGQAKRNIDLYINQSRNFSLGSILDSARFWYVEYLNAYKQFYDLWDLAVQDYIAGRIEDGDAHVQEGVDVEEKARTYLANSARDISYWQTAYKG